VTSLLAPGAGELVGDILAEVRSATGGETQISVDLGQPWAEDHAAAQAILPLVQLILISEEELRALLPGLSSPLTRDDEPEAIARLLARYECAPDTVAILKRRAQPTAVSEDEAELRPRVGGVMYRRLSGEVQLLRDEVLRDGLDKRQIIDSTGAGDFFAAAILADATSAHARAVQTLSLAAAMARHKFGHAAETAYAEVDRLLYADTVPPAAGKVFVSHSHADAEIVDALLMVSQQAMVTAHERSSARLSATPQCHSDRRSTPRSTRGQPCPFCPDKGLRSEPCVPTGNGRGPGTAHPNGATYAPGVSGLGGYAHPHQLS
jgi:hypothetical protein